MGVVPYPEAGIDTALTVLLAFVLLLVTVGVLLWAIGVGMLAYHYRRSPVARMAIQQIPRQFTGVKGRLMVVFGIPILMTLFVPLRKDIVPTDVTDEHRR